MRNSLPALVFNLVVPLWGNLREIDTVSTLTPIATEQWKPRLARHLLSRVGFGLPVERAAALAAMSPVDAVASLVDYDPGPHPARPDFVLEPVLRGDIKKANPELEFAQLQLLYQ